MGNYIVNLVLFLLLLTYMIIVYRLLMKRIGDVEKGLKEGIDKNRELISAEIAKINEVNTAHHKELIKQITHETKETFNKISELNSANIDIINEALEKQEEMIRRIRGGE